jgi:hypothetical protein
MLETLDNIGVPALLMTVPSNLRDWRPHVSIPTDLSKHAGRNELIAGRSALLNDAPAAAIEHLAKAVTASPAHAASHFHRVARSKRRPHPARPASTFCSTTCTDQDGQRRSAGRRFESCYTHHVVSG